MLFRSAGVEMRPAWTAKLTEFTDTVQYCCNRDLDKTYAEDKHFFSGHEMAELGARSQVAVSVIGKVKTTVQMVALLLMTARDPVLGLPIYVIGFVGLYAAAALTLWSMVIYLRAAWPELTRDSPPP